MSSQRQLLGSYLIPPTCSHGNGQILEYISHRDIALRQYMYFCQHFCEQFFTWLASYVLSLGGFWGTPPCTLGLVSFWLFICDCSLPHGHYHCGGEGFAWRCCCQRFLFYLQLDFYKWLPIPSPERRSMKKSVWQVKISLFAHVQEGCYYVIMLLITQCVRCKEGHS